MTAAPIILVPGFWLGAWAWDEVAAALRADGHDVTALTLPGLESADADRSGSTFADHVDAIVEAVEAADTPVVLVVHSASGFSGYAASDRVPERIAAMVYVDTAPGITPMDADFEDVEKPMIWKEIEGDENLDGISEAQKEMFRQRAVPVPGGVLRDSAERTPDPAPAPHTSSTCRAAPPKQRTGPARRHPSLPPPPAPPDTPPPPCSPLPTRQRPITEREKA